MSAVTRKESGDKPNHPCNLPERTNHQPQGSNTMEAPRMRAKARSKGPKLRPADARAMTINEVQMVTVMTAEAMPTARGDKPERNRILRLSGGWIISA